MHDASVFERAVGMRSRGRTLNEIVAVLPIAKGTASRWLKDVKITAAGQRRLDQRRHKGAAVIASLNAKRSASCQKRRDEAYMLGYRSRPSTLDAVGVGLYWGEGTKCDRSFRFSNSDVESVALIVAWAERAGQPKGEFTAHIQIHPEDKLSDRALKRHWQRAGVKATNIRIYRIRTKTSNGRVSGRTPYGTCRVTPIKNAVRLFEYMAGQTDKILGRKAKVNEAMGCKPILTE